MGDAFKAAAAPVSRAPTWSPLIRGTLDFGQMVYAPSDLKDANGIVGSISYQWQADGVQIRGSTDAFHLLTHADVGRIISVTARYVDGVGAAASISTSANVPTPMSAQAETLYAAGVAVMMLNRAFMDISPSVPVFLNQRHIAAHPGDGIAAFALEFGHVFDGIADDVLANWVIGNLGLHFFSNELVPALSAYFTIHSSERGAVVLQLAQLLVGAADGTSPGLEKYAVAGHAWIGELYASYAYSSDPANISPPSTAGSNSVSPMWHGAESYSKVDENLTLVGVPDFGLVTG